MQVVLSSTVADLDAAVAGLDLGVNDRDLAAVLAVRDRLDARIAVAVQAVDAAGLWDAVGATSMTAWTTDQGRMARPRAAVMTRVARLVAGLPVTAAAWSEGRLSTGQVETICSFLTDTTLEVFARHEPAIVPVLEPLSVPDVAAAMRAWRAHLDGPDPAPSAPSSLHASRTFAGRARVDGDLDAATGELVVDRAAGGRAGRPRHRGRTRAGPGPTPGRRPRRHLPVLPRPPERGAPKPPAPAPCEPGVRHGPRPRRHRVRHRRRPHHRRVPHRRGHRRPATCATASCTGSWSGASPPSWTTDAPPAPSPHRCGTSCCYATSTAAGKAATAPAPGAKPTTSSGGKRAAPPTSPTSSSFVAVTTTSPTGPAGPPNSPPTAPSCHRPLGRHPHHPPTRHRPTPPPRRLTRGTTPADAHQAGTYGRPPKAAEVDRGRRGRADA